jgi:hypothetical protein
LHYYYYYYYYHHHHQQHNHLKSWRNCQSNILKYSVRTSQETSILKHTYYHKLIINQNQSC